MKVNHFYHVLIGICFLAIAAGADQIKIIGVGAGTIENVSIVGSVLPLGGPNYSGGVYTGLYDAVDLTTGKAWQTFCIDPIGDISIGAQWNTNLLTGSQLETGTMGVLSTPSYGTSAAVTQEKYEMIGYLAQKYYYTPGALNASGLSDLSLAFWEIARDYNGNALSLDLTSGNFKVNSGDISVAQGFINDAAQNHGNSVSMWVFSPTERPSQEFIALKAVPEPGCLGMILVGISSLVGLGLARRKK
ncbi:MAG: hypothetical protein PHC61_07890 [Chitinivibrionales bacterium]|nr:hypothetical protein [Chitinivibrionales bacterium]